ncbi:MAG TPA: hypothetical protein PLD84_02365 [Chitinophagales bacterium]|nr:hypothetical protein [Chitinophagales bacterium]
MKNNGCFQYFRYLLIAFNFLPLALSAQPETSCNCAGMAPAGKGTLYVTAGYNLDWFSTSNIHFEDHTTDDYDFTLYKVKAEDRPGLKDLFHEDITIPQYSFRIGYWFNNKKDLAVEINYDHVKYVMIEGQRVHMTGSFRGEFYDQDTTLIHNFIRYEHTNGANYAMLDVVKRFNILHSNNQLHWLSAVAKAGGGFVLPRTDSWISGHHRDDTYHVAGFVVGGEVGLRYDFLKYAFLETTMKGCYANYFDVLLYGDGKASQHWWSAEYIFTLGLQIPVRLF